MGDIADMMINGEMCQFCGEYLGDEAGYPRSCSGCSEENKPVKAKAKKVKCGECGKKVSELGIEQHILAKHTASKLYPEA